MALAPSQQFMYGGIFLFLLVVVFSISALAVPKFGEIGAGLNGLSIATLQVGAFQMCVSILGGLVSSCGSIDSSCKVNLSLPGSGSGSGGGGGGGGSGLSDEPLSNCGTFNAFRGFAVTSLVFGGLALLSALLFACTASPSPMAGHVTFVSALTGCVMAAISLVCWYSVSTAFFDELKAAAYASDGNSAEVSTANSASFYLLISAMVAGLLGLAVWLYGVHQKRVDGGGSSMAAQPHFHNAPAHYVPDGQLNQPLTQQ